MFVTVLELVPLLALALLLTLLFARLFTLAVIDSRNVSMSNTSPLCLLPSFLSMADIVAVAAPNVLP